MSSFSVPITKILSITTIEGADSIELATVFGYQSVVRKGQYNVGDRVIYVPEGAIVPECILAQIGLSGKLAGKEKNRVKAIRLRGVISQGILLDFEIANTLPEGTDLQVELGITKYEPEIPVHMAGEVCNVGTEYTVSYDIENIQRYPDVFEEGEQVIITEKLHGTFCCFAFVPGMDNPELLNGEMYSDGHREITGNIFAFSKGLGSKGQAFKHNEANQNNIYHKTLLKYKDRLLEMYADLYEVEERAEPYTMFVMGEIYGKGIQDLQYSTDTPSFRIFDVRFRAPGEDFYVDAFTLFDVWSGFIEEHGLETVPVIYQGTFSKEIVDFYTSGTTMLGGKNIREGIVIKPKFNFGRRRRSCNRRILKSVSPDYLTRKGNVTEFN